MKKSLTFFINLLIFFNLSAQSITDFENLNLPAESFLNGSDSSGGFSFDRIFLPNDYNFDWNSWNGWAISNTTDASTPGFDNQYSSIVGKGADGSNTYATTFVLGESTVKAQGSNRFKNIMVTNATYTYLSMKDGDMFAKKFGGETGEDPDFLLLTIKGRKDGLTTSDSIDFYLADYRFEDNSQDYLVKDWTTINLESLGDVDELVFTLSGSDEGQFGLNTPAYFCIDNVETTETSSAENLNNKINLTVYPNPVSDFLSFDWSEGEGTIRVVDFAGRVQLFQDLNRGINSLNVSSFQRGNYILFLQTDNGLVTEKFVKQ